MATKKKGETFRERMDRNAKAGPKQRRIWHWKNRVKAAEARGESEEFIDGLKAARDKELKEMPKD